MTVKYETFFEIPDELADELIPFVANSHDGFLVFLEALDFIYPNIDIDVVLALWKECEDEAKCREKEKLLKPCPECGNQPRINFSIFGTVIECDKCQLFLHEKIDESFESLADRWNKQKEIVHYRYFNKKGENNSGNRNF